MNNSLFLVFKREKIFLILFFLHSSIIMFLKNRKKYYQYQKKERILDATLITNPPAISNSQQCGMCQEIEYNKIKDIYTAGFWNREFILLIFDLLSISISLTSEHFCFDKNDIKNNVTKYIFINLPQSQATINNGTPPATVTTNDIKIIFLRKIFNFLRIGINAIDDKTRQQKYFKR